MKKRIAFIGTGRKAWSLAQAFREAGYELVFAVSRTEKHLRHFTAHFKIENMPKTPEELKLLLQEPLTVILAVPDSEISPVALELAQLDLPVEDSLFIHLSGAKNSTELAPLRDNGAFTGTLHIPQTFPTTDPVSIQGLPVAVEASSPEAEKMLLQLAHDLNLHPICIAPENKIYYHLAAVFASNFFPAIVADSIRLFEKAGGSREDYFKIFAPIITTTFTNIIKHGPENSVSGVVSRKDSETIGQHLASLTEDPTLKGVLDTYLHLTAKTATLLGVEVDLKQPEGGSRR